ncbi:MAG: hypothetical protein RLZZ459_2237 [Cyanobacteriota bacterium]|jgi:ATP/maltotriose-dependent transcriptional regulator MalT
MSIWRVALLPSSSPSRARVRWLTSDGRFTVAVARAWTVADPQTAAQRLQHWLSAHGRDPALLQRLKLLPDLDAEEHPEVRAGGMGFRLIRR